VEIPREGFSKRWHSLLYALQIIKKLTQVILAIFLARIVDPMSYLAARYHDVPQ
jgi:hypothetical protein